MDEDANDDNKSTVPAAPQVQMVDPALVTNLPSGYNYYMIPKQGSSPLPPCSGHVTTTAAMEALADRKLHEEQICDNAQLCLDSYFQECSKCSRQYNLLVLGLEVNEAEEIMSNKHFFECARCSLKRKRKYKYKRKSTGATSSDIDDEVAASTLLGLSQSKPPFTMEDNQLEPETVFGPSEDSTAELDDFEDQNDDDADKPAVGSRIIICRCTSRSDILSRRPSLEGQMGTIVEMPRYPCTWISVRLDAGKELIKLRTTNFKIVKNGIQVVPVRTARTKRSMLFNSLEAGRNVLLLHHHRFKPSISYPAPAIILKQAVFPCTWVTICVKPDQEVLKVRTRQIARNLEEAREKWTVMGKDQSAFQRFFTQNPDFDFGIEKPPNFQNMAAQLNLVPVSKRPYKEQRRFSSVKSAKRNTPFITQPSFAALPRSTVEDPGFQG